jgi:hypothetical protein
MIKGIASGPALSLSIAFVQKALVVDYRTFGDSYFLPKRRLSGVISFSKLLS